MFFSFRFRLLACSLCGLGFGPLGAVSAGFAQGLSKQAATPAGQEEGFATEDQIIAVVNGQILTNRDVDDREKLFMLSTGLNITTEAMARMRGQIIQQLIDERLKLQEMLSRHINIEPEQIAESINNIETRNGLPKGTLRERLKNDGTSLTTLIDQLRVQLGWMQVLREELGPRSRVTPAQITQREKALAGEAGRPQYFISEIFVPVADPDHDETELNFTNTIISELRRGAPFAIVAAQFSQDKSALDGGSMGWVQEDHLEPEVVAIVRKMPDGAISNPIRVPGGFVIATVHARRVVGKQMGTLVKIRQAFYPFTTALDPANPTEQQRQTLIKATAASKSVTDCAAMEQLNTSLGNIRPADPGTQIMEHLSPQMRGLLERLPAGHSTQPLVSHDGIALLMVCSKEQRNLAQQTPGQIADQLMNERVEQAARQLQRSLHRRAVIQIRPAARLGQTSGNDKDKGKDKAHMTKAQAHKHKQTATR